MAEICDNNAVEDEAQQQDTKRYWLLEILNAGSYGVVYRGLDTLTREIVAIKHETHGLSKSTMREINILSSLPPHPSIVGIRDVAVDEWWRVFVVMEHMETDLNKWMKSQTKPLTLSELKSIMKQILQGMKFLHENGVMHRDLKPANILINTKKAQVKICDFGLSRPGMGEGPYTPGVVTQWYRAPELLAGVESYSNAIDMWSVGCIMAELVLREALFPGKTEIQQLKYIMQIVGSCPFLLKLRVADAITYEGAPMITAAGMDLLYRLLDLSASSRITAEDALNHIWFKEFYGLLSD